jgi:hypothetical protein
MTGTAWIVFSATVGIAAPWLIYLPKRWQRKTSSSLPSNSAHLSRSDAGKERSYAAVTIRPGKVACTAVVKVVGERFLCTEAPTLPLPTCDQASCDCQYLHHKDRRPNLDRRSTGGTYGRNRPPLGGDERRNWTDRRIAKN